MEMVMCRSCGKFVTALRQDGMRVPVADACPECGGTAFTDVADSSIGDDDE